SYKLGVLCGDGIGKEITDTTVNMIKDIALFTKLVDLNFEYLPMGWEAIKEMDNPMPEEVKLALEKKDAWIMGPHDSVSYPEPHQKTRNPSGELRHYFDLYANIRPSKSIPGIPSVAKNADLVIFRENTEGFYTDLNMVNRNCEL